MILILTGPVDRTADLVAHKLARRGAEVVRFDTASFPSRSELTIAFSPQERTCALLRSGEMVIDLERLTAVWLRRGNIPVPHASITESRSREVVSQESRAVLLDAWHTTACRWVPAPPQVLHEAQRKLGQLSLAGELGFELPPTLVTTDPDALLAFYQEHGGAIISKLAGIEFHKLLGHEFARYTEVVSRRDIAYLDAVRYCPMIYQAYVPKRVELRVTVVGSDVFAAEIHSQASNHTRYDWRRYDEHTTPYARHELPPDLQRLCVELTARLGLCYGAIDLVLTPDGRYVFLEINPAGQFQWIEQATGLPISDAICDLLLAVSRAEGIGPSLADNHLGGVL